MSRLVKRQSNLSDVNDGEQDEKLYSDGRSKKLWKKGTNNIHDIFGMSTQTIDTLCIFIHTRTHTHIQTNEVDRNGRIVFHFSRSHIQNKLPLLQTLEATQTS